MVNEHSVRRPSGRIDARALFAKLLDERPAFHGVDEAVNLNLMQAVQQWMFDRIQPGWVTLETGCGYSTVVAALRGAEHTVISPVAAEHRRLREWLERNGVPLDGLTFVADRSESVLPDLKGPPLDLVLIDGRHAFPSPFIDWYYTSSRLKVGGYVIVDDTQIRPCGVLRDFLDGEARVGRWEHVTTLFRTSVFRKTAEQLNDHDWEHQPWSRGSANWRDAARDAFNALLRHTVGRSPRLKRLGHEAYSRLRNG